MKKFFTSIIALCLCLAISILAVGCGEANPYKSFVKKYGSHYAEIKVEEGSINKDYVMNRYSLTGKYEGSTSGSFVVRMKEVTVSTNDTPQTDDDISKTIEYTVHYRQSDDQIFVYLDRYSFFEGSTTLDKANMSGFKYEFKYGITLDGQSAQDQAESSEKNCFVFDASKYFDDNELSMADASKVLTLNSEDMTGSQTTSIPIWLEQHATWSDDILSDLLDAANKTLEQVDKLIEEKLAK